VTIVFKKPPLLELISELRWGPPTLGLSPSGNGPVSMVAGGQPLQFTLTSAYDAFFMRFGVEAHRLGFTIQERVVPHNTVLMPYQTVWRWMRRDNPGLFLQLGVGVFTVNGSPPTYSHWDNFSSTVKDGVDGLLAAFEDYPGGRPTVFGQTLLRYIDLFDGESVRDTPPLGFLSDVMGMKIGIPESISKFASAEGRILPQLSLQIPIDQGILSLMFGYGVAAGRTGHVFDSTVTRSADVELDSQSVVDSFAASHAITNEIFMSLTRPLHDEMEPFE